MSSGHIVFYRGCHEKKECGAGFLVHREIAGSVEEFSSIKKRVGVAVIKLNKKYRLKIVQALRRQLAMITRQYIASTKTSNQQWTKKQHNLRLRWETLKQK